MLGPDGLRREPKTVAGLRTFQAAGGTQALRRTRIVLVVLDDRKPVAVRCPDLLGAILIKARVALKMRKRKYLSDRQDLIRLLSYVDDPRALAAEATRSERSWLREVEATVDFDNATLVELFPDERLVRARQALKLLGQAGFPALSEM